MAFSVTYVAGKSFDSKGIKELYEFGKECASSPLNCYMRVPYPAELELVEMLSIWDVVLIHRDNVLVCYSTVRRKNGVTRVGFGVVKSEDTADWIEIVRFLANSILDKWGPYLVRINEKVAGTVFREALPEAVIERGMASIDHLKPTG